MNDFPITIFHNPSCGTSRNVVAMVRAAGYAPEIVEYLKIGWTREKLEKLLTVMRAKPRDVVRARGTPAAELGLLEPGASDDRILDAMAAHPILVERPIVLTPMGCVLARPADKVLALLERRPPDYR